jgi:hypothetical protein
MMLKKWWPLLLISALGLFLEMVAIRWVSSEVRLLSYFKNLPLLAAFLGLAIGFSLAGSKRDYLPSFLPLLGLYALLVLGIGRVLSPRGLGYPGGGDTFIWMTADFSYWLSLALFIGVMLVFFIATMLLFIPLGQATGREMAPHPPVPAYIVNILGSLAGIWIYALISFMQTPPAVWFALALAGLAVFLAKKQILSRMFVVGSLAGVITLAFLSANIYWSPYQRLDLVRLTLNRESDNAPVDVGYTLKVQQVFHLVALDLSDRFLSSLHGDIPSLEGAALTYNLPYQLGIPTGKVLVVGAGMGNDVAAALRGGAGHVDAVEIDPAIASLGTQLHPEKPFTDPRVRLVIDDARSFLQNTPERYDLIVFGYLDSQTLLSGFSSVRLDSFVYTVESFKQAQAHLTDHGVLTLAFAIGTPWIEQRLGEMLVEVFGADRVYAQKMGMGTTFVVGSISPQRIQQNYLSLWQPAGDSVPMATDDWPYLYMRARNIPAAYWQVLLAIGIVCLILTGRSFPETLHPQFDFLLLGAAFMLIELKSVTELALLFGTTWLVNVFAISGVLIMALAANLLILKIRRGNLAFLYILLLGSLGFIFLLPTDLMVGWTLLLRGIGGTILLSVPLFFAGMIFSETLRRAGEAARPLASNLTGSALGGVLEYGSLLGGIKSLYIVAAVLYVGSWAASRVYRR